MWCISRNRPRVKLIMATPRMDSSTPVTFLRLCVRATILLTCVAWVTRLTERWVSWAPNLNHMTRACRPGVILVKHAYWNKDVTDLLFSTCSVVWWVLAVIFLDLRSPKPFNSIHSAKFNLWLEMYETNFYLRRSHAGQWVMFGLLRLRRCI